MLGTAEARGQPAEPKNYGKPVSSPGVVPPRGWVQRSSNDHTAPITMLAVAAELISATLMPW